jgi:hypothetical protein
MREVARQRAQKVHIVMVSGGEKSDEEKARIDSDLKEGNLDAFIPKTPDIDVLSGQLRGEIERFIQAAPATRPAMSAEEAFRFLAQQFTSSVDELEEAMTLAQDIPDSIHKIMVAGGGMKYLPLFLALMGKDVVFVDLEAAQIGQMRAFVSSVEKALKLRLPIKFIEREIGALPAQPQLDGAFDLITFIDLVGEKPQGNIRAWLNTAKRLLKPHAYAVIDEKAAAEYPSGMRDVFLETFPAARRFTQTNYFGSYNLDSSGRNYFYEIFPSSTAAGQGPGGIDFRGLPIVTQPVPSHVGLANIPVSADMHPNLSDGLVSRPPTGNEWQEIEKMLKAGITPSAERIKEYLAGSCATEDFTEASNRVLSCIAEILRLEEENCCATDAALRGLLILLESGKPAQEMKLVLAKKGI